MNFLETFLKIITNYWSVFLEGTIVTLGYAAVTVLFGLILGAAISLIRMKSSKVLQGILKAYVEIIRGTPLLLQLYFFYYAIPLTFGTNIPKVICIIIALVINSSAYIAEIIRSGIQAVDKGQFEASKSLGMSDSNMMMKIILPQAVKNILPALGNEFISVVKETSLAAVFFAGDLMTSFNIVKSNTFKSIEPLVVIGIIYFILNYVLSKGVNKLERRLAQSD
ncbi:MAG: amino acid ABC transporter permease [Erysipelotrichaceae bacterium]